VPQRLRLSPLEIDTRRVLFDITRLYRNRQSRFGTGVDRIDLAIGRELDARFGDDCRFIHVCHGGFSEMPRQAARRLLVGLDARWHDGIGQPPKAAPWALLAGRCKSGLGLFGDLSDCTYVVASHSGLPQRAGHLKRLDPTGMLRQLAYIHDIIPLEYPEYQTPRSQRIFRQYLAELAAGDTRYVVNSADTAARLSAYMSSSHGPIESPIVNIPTLVGAPPSGANARPAVLKIINAKRPYFIVLGTIEPRKNHLLLLNLWREIAADQQPPLLVVIGRRGWMNDNIVTLLDQSLALRGNVAEFSDLSDAEIAGLMQSARALLFPSFAEGLGLPLLEARAAGLPVIASNLPAFHEIADQGVTMLDPLNGPAWRQAIEEAAK
jgi:glycosyltransferase involved in cell wall biosynthesis